MREAFGDLFNLKDCPLPKSILMADPKFYQVSYAINSHMLDEKGELNQVNPMKAIQEWLGLKRCFENLGYPVKVVPASLDLPDLVFAANQSLALPDGRVVLSKMKSSMREGEVEVFKSWYQKNGVSEFIEMDSTFEGMGDFVWHPQKKLLWGGFGYRSDQKSLKELYEKTEIPIIPLKLVDERFYHLDTCFSILDGKTVAYFPLAFDEASRNFIEEWFERVIILDEDESLKYFAGNCYCPDGENIILHPGAIKFEKKLLNLGYKLHRTKTFEFIKGGGSVFCMKLPLFF